MSGEPGGLGALTGAFETTHFEMNEIPIGPFWTIMEQSSNISRQICLFQILFARKSVHKALRAMCTSKQR